MANTYLSRTPGNNYYLKATFSFWFKRSSLGEMGLFGRRGSNSTANLSTCHFSSDNSLLINFRDSGGTSQYYQITNRKFRDTSNWYHFHYIVDGDNSTQGDRSRVYINGVRETDFSLNNNVFTLDTNRKKFLIKKNLLNKNLSKIASIDKNDSVIIEDIDYEDVENFIFEDQNNYKNVSSIISNYKKFQKS